MPFYPKLTTLQRSQPSLSRLAAIAVALTGLLLVFTTITAHALPEDSEQPIYISSNSAVKDEKEGITIYRGNVDIKQGSLHIQGDEVTIYVDGETVQRIVAVGRPAKFRQKPAADKTDVSAQGINIEYRLDRDSIVLTDQALLEQQGDLIRANTIRYDLTTDLVEAGGSDDRVNIVIQPQKQN